VFLLRMIGSKGTLQPHVLKKVLDECHAAELGEP
jgi:hypothetical protein